MPRAFASSRVALILRRLRGRFGIAAPRVAVRAHMPWRWRILAIVVVLVAAFVLGSQMYDTGRGFVIPASDASVSEMETLRIRAGELADEVQHLRGIANAAESSQKIDRTAIDELTRQVKALEAENAKLKESIAVFENLATNSDRGESLSLTRLRVQPMAAPGHYRYKMLASWRGDETNKGEFKGVLSFQVTVRRGGQQAVIIVPDEKEREGRRFAVSFKNFSSLEGTLEIPADTKVERVEARLIQNGIVKASQSIPL